MVQPLQDWVMIEPIEIQTKTASGIILHNIHIPKPVRGTIISIGPLCEGIMGNALQIGDVVLYPKQAVNSIKDEDKEYLIVKESELLCVIR